MNVLLAVDGSEHSENAARQVASRPWPAGSSVRVLHVLPSPMLTPPDFEPPSMALGAPAMWPVAAAETIAALTEAASKLVTRVAGVLEREQLRVDTKVREGDARTEIVEEAKQWPADLIVMGSHGYTGLKRWLLGSVAQSVLSHAPCSVEVVRTRANHE